MVEKSSLARLGQVAKESAKIRLGRLGREGPWGPYLREAFAPNLPIVDKEMLLGAGYVSQIGQDLWLDQILFGKAENGTFIDVGAHDGRSLSNSWFLEKVRQWRGVCVEPNPQVFEHLTRERSSICLNVAVSNNTEREQEYVIPDAPALSMLSGFRASYSRAHWKRLCSEARAANSALRSVFVEVRTLAQIAAEFDLSRPDVLMLDVEGAEMSVLGSADWNTFRPSVVLLESNYGATREIRFLRARGYELLFRIGWDLVFVSADFVERRSAQEQDSSS